MCRIIDSEALIEKSLLLKKGDVVANTTGNFLQIFYGVYNSTYGLNTKGSCETLVNRGYLSTSECDELAGIFGTGEGAVVTDAEKTRLREMGFSQSTVEYIAGDDGKNLFLHRLEWLRDNFKGGLLWNDYSASNRADMAVELGEMGVPVAVRDLATVYYDFNDELYQSPVLIRAIASIARYYPESAIKFLRGASEKNKYAPVARAVAVEAIETFDSIHVLTHLSGAATFYAVDLVTKYIDKVYEAAADGDLNAVDAIAAYCDRDLRPYLKKLAAGKNRDAASRADIWLKDCHE